MICRKASQSAPQITDHKQHSSFFRMCISSLTKRRKDIAVYILMHFWACQPPDWEVSALQSARISSKACFARLEIRRSTTYVAACAAHALCCVIMSVVLIWSVKMYQKHWVAAESGESWSTWRCSVFLELSIFRSLTSNEYFMTLWISDLVAELLLGFQ